MRGEERPREDENMQSQAGHRLVVLAAAVVAISGVPRLAAGQIPAARTTDSTPERIEIQSVHATARAGEPLIEFASTPAEKLLGADIKVHCWIPGAASNLRPHLWDPYAARPLPVPGAPSRIPFKSWEPGAPSAIRVHHWEPGAPSRIRVHRWAVSQMRGRRAIGR